MAPSRSMNPLPAEDAVVTIGPGRHPPLQPVISRRGARTFTAITVAAGQRRRDAGIVEQRIDSIGQSWLIAWATESGSTGQR